MFLTEHSLCVSMLPQGFVRAHTPKGVYLMGSSWMLPQTCLFQMSAENTIYTLLNAINGHDYSTCMRTFEIIETFTLD